MVPVTAPGASSAPADAAEALRLAQTEPWQARALALSARARSGADLATRGLAEQALGQVAWVLHQSDDAARHLRAAVRLALRADRPEQAAEAQLGLAYILVHRGDAAGALRAADHAGAVLGNSASAALLTRRAAVLQQLGRFDEALDGYRRALAAIRRDGDRLWEARLLCNRGVVHTYRHDFRAAERDLLRSERLYTDLGQALAAAQVRHNLGFLAARRGDVPAALAAFDAAAGTMTALGLTDPVGLLDRCETLLAARLVEEARAVAERAVAQLAAARRQLKLQEGRLLLAQVALLDGDADTARRTAAAARRGFSRQKRDRWAALARYTVVRADWALDVRTPAALARARATADDLAEAGWALPALDARLVAARLALALGRTAAARAELSLAGAACRRGPVELRARAWHARALLRLADGNRGGAFAALRAGMGVLERHRATLGATELRAHVSGYADELAALGLRLSLDTGRAVRVLLWAERWRAGALHLRPVLPPDDTDLRADLAELRGVVARLDEAALSGRPTRALLARQAGLERAIQDRARRAKGAAQALTERQVDVRSLSAALGERALVEYVRLDGRLHAVTVAGGRVRLRDLGAHAPVEAELAALRFALRRLAHGRGSVASLQAARLAADHAARTLDSALLGPLAGQVAERPLVVVPTGALHALPWAALPSCAGRAVAVAPSAALWAAAHRRAQASGPGSERVVLVAGGQPAHAAAEVGALAETYPDAVCLQGPRAVVGAALQALDGAGLAHLACHGSFRADNPLFSCLALADGALTVYDLEGMAQAPRTLVLSACESGLSGVAPGDELMGLTSALFALGASTLIASVAPVPDAATRTLMLDVHARLRAGLSPADALAAAQAARPQGSGFVCFGAG